jgi:hypothetical protein
MLRVLVPLLQASVVLLLLSLLLQVPLLLLKR